jgi:3-hydroxybutyryl-CoA dehydrogenase
MTTDGDSTVNVLGCGTMGQRIAICCALAGMRVRVLTTSDPATREGALQKVAKRECRLAGIDRDVTSEALTLISVCPEWALMYSGVPTIETVAENLVTKRQILSTAEEELAPSLLATNTSSLSVTELAEALSRPDVFLGLHFLNSPVLVHLVEIISSPHTSDESLMRTTKFADRIGKQVLTSPDRPGFTVNRLLFPCIAEAIKLLGEGTQSAKDINDAMTVGAHHPIGPLDLADLIGLDVCLAILDGLYRETNTESYKPPELLVRLVNLGYLGKKNGRTLTKYFQEGMND